MLLESPLSRDWGPGHTAHCAIEEGSILTNAYTELSLLITVLSFIFFLNTFFN